MKTKTILTSLFVAAGLLSAATFQAAAQAGGGGGGGGGGRGGGRGGVLTQEQNQQIRDAIQGNTEMTALAEKLTAAQKEAVTAALAKDATDASVRAKVEAVAKIQTDIAMLRFSKGVKPVIPSITADQKTQLDAAPGMSYNQLFGGGFGGRGGMGGGGPRGGGAGAPGGAN